MLDGEVQVFQYTLLVDEIALIGIIIIDMIRVEKMTKKCGIGIVFQVDSNDILYIRECEDIDEITNTYRQVRAGEYSNNQMSFVDTSGVITLIKYTKRLWAKRLGYMPS